MKILITAILLVTLIGCKKEPGAEGQPVGPSSPQSKSQSPGGPPPATAPQPAIPTSVTEVVKATEENERRDQAEKMFSDWREGNKPPGLISATMERAPDGKLFFVDHGVLLDYKIITLKRKESIKNWNVQSYWEGTVNLRLQTDAGTPAEKQYKFNVIDKDGKRTLLLLPPRE